MFSTRHPAHRQTAACKAAEIFTQKYFSMKKRIFPLHREKILKIKS